MFRPPKAHARVPFLDDGQQYPGKGLCRQPTGSQKKLNRIHLPSITSIDACGHFTAHPVRSRRRRNAAGLRQFLSMPIRCGRWPASARKSSRSRAWFGLEPRIRRDALFSGTVIPNPFTRAISTAMPISCTLIMDRGGSGRRGRDRTQIMMSQFLDALVRKMKEKMNPARKPGGYRFARSFKGFLATRRSHPLILRRSNGIVEPGKRGSKL